MEKVMPMNYFLSSAMLLIVTQLLAGCHSTGEPRVTYAGPPGNQSLVINGQPARYDPEADRLIDRLGLSKGMRQVARDFVATEMARGIAARPAVENWVLIHKPDEVIVSCSRLGTATVECVAR
jgi:hypothetical protein